MNILEEINCLFGISNETSATIFVTISVFVIGGIMTLLYSAITSYINRRDMRVIFREMLEQIIKDTEKAEKNLLNFYPYFNTDHNPNPFIYTRITHLYSISEIGFQKSYASFSWWIKSRLHKKTGKKFFHRIFSTIDLLQTFEGFQLRDFENYRDEFHSAENEFTTNLFNLQDYLEQLNYEVFPNLPRNNKTVQDFFKALQSILDNFSKSEKTNSDYMNLVVIPMLQLNKLHRGFKFTPKLDAHLFSCKRSYEEILLLVNLYTQTFKNHYLVHRRSKRILKVCCKAIS